MKGIVALILVVFIAFTLAEAWQVAHPTQKERLLEAQGRESEAAARWLHTATRYARRRGIVDSVMVRYCLTRAVQCSGRADSLARLYEKEGR